MITIIVITITLAMNIVILLTVIIVVVIVIVNFYIRFFWIEQILDGFLVHKEKSGHDQTERNP